jgi:alpha-tubulin suppressor-like RCC1 family protein
VAGGLARGRGRRSRAIGRLLVSVAALLMSTVVALIAVPAPAATAAPLQLDVSRIIATGSGSNCAITAAHTVRCWGANDGYEMADGTHINRATPVDVAGPTDVVAVTAGWTHICALTSGGRVWCWGGEGIGNGSRYALSPVSPTGMTSGVVAIDAGYNATCAVKDDGTVWCWGEEIRGNLNDLTPVQVPGLSGITSISVETFTGYMGCAGSPTGVWCWSGGASPVPVPGIGGVRDVQVTTAGSCAVSTSRQLECWGLGWINGTGTDSDVPVVVPGLDGPVRALAMQERTACAVTDPGSLWCWGGPNDAGFGGDAAQPEWTPHQVTNIGGPVVAVDTTMEDTCAVLADGRARCWGATNSWNGTLGQADWTGAYRAPHTVPGFDSGVADVAAGGHFTCTYSPADGVRCGGLLPPTIPVRTTDYVPISALDSTRAIRAGQDFACAISTSDGVSCWGANDQGQLGNGTTTGSATPVPVTGLSSGVVELDLGGQSACAILTGGDLQCWGANSQGQLGNNSTTASSVPVQVIGLTSGVTSVATGPHTCAGTTSGIQCWGANTSGELGDGTKTARTTPVAVTPTVTGTPTVSSSSTCATDGAAVRCWGANNFGQLGNGTTTTPSLVPVQVPAGSLPSSIVSLTGASQTMCAMGSDGSQRCWGDNQSGSVGSGSQDFWLPVPSPTVAATNVVRSSADPSSDQVCAITTAGALQCWGRANEGQHGFAAWRPHTVDGGAQFAQPPKVPGIPAFIRASSGNASAKVSWFVPASNGSPVTGYVVTPILNGTPLASQTFNTTATSDTVTGLTNGLTYTFKVAAINGVGTGPQSGAGGSVVVGLPGTPGFVRGTSGDSSAVVSWNAAPANGHAITGYIVTPYLAGVAQSPQTFNSASGTQRVTGLTNGQTYTFKVQAKNTIGTGPISSASAGILIGLPGVPSFLSTISLDSSAKVAWHAPPDNGSAITGYVVTPYQGTTALAPQTFNSTATTQTVTGLTNGVTYTFKVAAINGLGTGPSPVPPRPPSSASPAPRRSSTSHR